MTGKWDKPLKTRANAYCTILSCVQAQSKDAQEKNYVQSTAFDHEC